MFKHFLKGSKLAGIISVLM